MCGFCGVLRHDGAAVDADRLAAMNRTLIHRGPDDGHLVLDGPVGLANRRLAILDLRPEARLPMTRGDVSIAYNGEVYNFRAARAALEAKGQTFTTESDTEVILGLYREHGEQVGEHLDGMYAFAIWDAAQQALYLGRDPAGKKPLFYYQDEEKLVFGSEIKAILAHPGVPRRPRLDLLPYVLAYGYAPTPETCFEGIQAVQPGELLRLRDGRLTVVGRSGPQLHCTGTGDPAAPWEDRLLDTLRAAVAERLVSDVPLGAFLSGGIDSSLIVALMSELAEGRVKTFSIGFEGEPSYDETGYAEQVAALFGTDHTAFRVDPPQVQELLPTLVWHHDQPFADSSAIPTLLLSRLTREQVTVALSGDGGDELFAGYDRFLAVQRATTGLAGWPALRPLYGLGARLAGRLPQRTGYADKAQRAWRFFDGARRPMPAGYARWVRVTPRDLIAELFDPAAAEAADRRYAAAAPTDGERDWVSRILDLNYRTYLLDDLLVKADRTSMAASLEVRAPFLSNAMVELAGEMPTAVKLRGGRPKAVLRDAAARYLPAAIIDRPKHGFGVPVGTWFRGSLAPYARELLLDSLAPRGIVNPAAIGRILDEHVSARRDWGHVLWTLCTLEHWWQQFIDPAELRCP